MCIRDSTYGDVRKPHAHDGQPHAWRGYDGNGHEQYGRRRQHEHTMIKLFIALLLVGSAIAQTGSWPTAATDQDLIVAKTACSTTLTTGINASTLTVVVANGSLCAQYGVIRIDNEYMQICSIATNTLTICSGTRGLVGSAATHSAGAQVRDVVSEYHHNRTRAEIKAMQAKLLPATSGTTPPGTCAANRELFVDRDASPNPTLHLCNATGDGWLDIAGGGGTTFSIGASGILSFTAGVLDGDTAIVCRKGDSCAPTGAQNWSNAATTKPGKDAASDPAVCGEGEKYWNTTSKKYRNCTATNTWSDEAATGAGTGNVSASGALTANLPVFGAGSTDVVVGTRSGNTTEVVTQSGAKTAGKQTTYDANGNLVASAYDAGGGGGSSVTFTTAHETMLCPLDTCAAIGYTTLVHSPVLDDKVFLVALFPKANYTIRRATISTSGYLSYLDSGFAVGIYSAAGARFRRGTRPDLAGVGGGGVRFFFTSAPAAARERGGVGGCRLRIKKNKTSDTASTQSTMS